MSFPALSYLSNAARTEGEMKTALEDQLKGIKQIPGAGIAEQALTIATGSITPASGASGILLIDTEAAAATDDLTNMSVTNFDDGSLILLHSASSARVIVVKNAAGGSGQFTLKSSGDFTLGDTARHWLLVKRSGTTWAEVARYPSADFAPVLAKSALYTTTVADRGQLIDCTANTFTVTLLAAASAGRGFEQPIRNSGVGLITIDGNAAETIDGAATVLLFPGDSAYLVCDGTNWKTVARFASKSLASSAKTGAYTVVEADRGTLIDCTSGTFSLILTAAATLGSGFEFWARNSGTGTVTIDANASETIDGNLTYILPPGGMAVFLFCDGTNWKTLATNVQLAIGTLQATTSGTSKDFTGIPAWARRICIALNGVSVSGTSILQVQLGDAGGVEGMAGDEAGDARAELARQAGRRDAHYERDNQRNHCRCE